MHRKNSNIIKIASISKKDIAEVKTFLENGFGQEAGSRWLKKHLEQPLSLNVNAPVGVGAWRNDQLVGHFGAVFWHLSTPNKTMVAAVPGDLLIAPEIQHTPLAGRVYIRMWNRLFKQMRERGAPIIVGFGNGRSMRLHERFGGVHIQKVRHILTWRSLPGIPVALQQIFWQAWWHLYTGNHQGLTVETKSPNKEDLDNIWRIRSHSQTHNGYQRDARYLRYRYGNGSYHIWGIRSSTNIIGYVVWDQHDRIIAIKDIFAVRSALTKPILIAVLRKIMSRANKQGNHFLRIRLLEDPSIGSLLKLGFRMTNEPISWATRAVTMEEDDFAHLMRTGKWYFTMGDVDQW
jgi:hypothetical protein